MDIGYCLIQALLDASAYLRRPLNAERLHELYKLVEEFGAYPSTKLNELIDILEDLEPLIVLTSTKGYISPNLPCIVLYKEDGDKAHAEFFPNYKDKENGKISGLIVFVDNPA